MTEAGAGRPDAPAPLHRELTVAEAAELAGVATSYIRRLCQPEVGALIARRGPAPGKQKDQWWIDPTSFSLWLASKPVRPAAGPEPAPPPPPRAPEPPPDTPRAETPPTAVTPRELELLEQNFELRLQVAEANARAREAILRSQRDAAVSQAQLLGQELSRRRRDLSRLLPMVRELVDSWEEDLLADELRTSGQGGMPSPAPAGHPDDHP